MKQLLGKNTKFLFRTKGNKLVPYIYLENKVCMTGHDFIFIKDEKDIYYPRISKVREKNDKLLFESELRNKWLLNGTISLIEKLTEYYRCTLSLQYLGQEDRDFSIHVMFDVLDSGIPRWLIPGLFYKYNRPREHRIVDSEPFRKYPRYAYKNGKIEDYMSDHWAFRTDRCPTPAVFCWTNNFTACLATKEQFSHGIAGVGFQGNKERICLSLNFPYSETPIRIYNEEGTNPVEKKLRIRKDETINFEFYIYVAKRDLHAYNNFIRDFYYSEIRQNPLSFKISKKKACSILAQSIYRWHYKKKHRMLSIIRKVETNYDKKRYFTIPEEKIMYTAWIGGIPYAYALLLYGKKTNNKNCINGAKEVLGKISEGITPIGTFWTMWQVDDGWGTGVCNPLNSVQSRTISEATYFMLKAIELEGYRVHSRWDKAVKRNLDFIINIQREDGNFGMYYDVITGKVNGWSGTGGILWVAALIEGWKYFNNVEYLNAAIKGGKHYAKYVEDEYLFGAPEDVNYTPSSEDGYNAIIAYVHLYESTKDKKWLRLAKKSADWTMTFRWTYNIRFQTSTTLNASGFKSRGADHASVCNNHMHFYGLICHEELLRLWEYTGDDYYIERANDHLLCSLQTIAQKDGEFGLRKGMVTEQLNNTDWFRTKGETSESLSFIWSAGMILRACIESHRYGDIIVDWKGKKVFCMEAVELENIRFDKNLILDILNPWKEEVSLNIVVIYPTNNHIILKANNREILCRKDIGRYYFPFNLSPLKSIRLELLEVY